MKNEKIFGYHAFHRPCMGLGTFYLLKQKFHKLYLLI